MLAGAPDARDAYCVEVFYRHHGQRRVSFPVTRDRWFISGRELACHRAHVFYDKMCQKMRRASENVPAIFEIKCNTKAK